MDQLRKGGPVLAQDFATIIKTGIVSDEPEEEMTA